MRQCQQAELQKWQLRVYDSISISIDIVVVGNTEPERRRRGDYRLLSFVRDISRLQSRCRG
jgi:hypothetical protein